ncbi:NTPase, DNA primase [Adoxophyes honmai entomopoxvirus 'L']|uniref:NTPase, DNA primase n=1 Tax=Adoxophyes honmai entomopoxvirus 'L' TaxID=1293540 RepID=A0A916KNZ8_9POXV|nr:NTPase, DNA primase [Adoxophyes honmai entomopoxvirus 'L']CCU55406.1 NTPase, DNA primase [Adoxophyes honmai entomopoxvirus 'L']
MGDTNYIYLQKTLLVSLDLKIRALINNEKINSISKINTSKIYNKILVCKDNDTHLDYEYHEFILDNYHTHFKLFFDIDYSTNYNMDHFKKNFKDFKKIISVELCEIITSNFNISVNNITKDNILDFIKKNICFTVSNNPNKLSLHIFFNKIYVTPKSFTDLKKYIKELKIKVDNILIKNIDLAPFRKNTQLRFIYSKKNDSEYFHYDYNPKIIEIEDLYKYIITHVNFDDDYMIIESKNVTIENVGIIYPHIKYFKGPNFVKKFTTDLKNYQIKVSPETRKHIREKHSAVLDEIMEINLIFNDTICNICKKSAHKNGRILKFTENKILLIKQGNYSNCNILRYSYPQLGGFELADYIKDLNIITKVESDVFVFWKNGKWVKLDSISIFQGLTKYVLDTYKNNMLLHDIEYMSNKFFTECKSRISATLSLKYSDININPYIIQFNNGVYDLSKSKFYYGDDAKKYIRLNYIKIDYIDIENMNDKERSDFDKNYNILINTFNMIIPKNDKNRTVFETNISSVLHYCHKPIITIFYGPTSCGKSTIKALLRQLFFDMFLDLPIEFYQNNISRNAPNAWLGKIEGKCVSFASEGEINKNEKFLAVNIKQYTEPYINGRDLHNSKCVHKNTLTQFIDLNPEPVFNNNDNALIKRIAIIELGHTYFINEKLSRDTVNITSGNRNIVYADPLFDTKIINNEFTLPLFYILKEWSNKYHSISINLLNTPDIFKTEKK